MYRFPNIENNEWFEKYNSLVAEIEAKADYYKEYKKTQPKRNDKNPDCWKDSLAITIHHIIPKSIDKSLEKDKENLLYVPFVEHCQLHYYLWKGDKSYASQLWWICIAGRKLGKWQLPGGETEYEQLKKDLKQKKL